MIHKPIDALSEQDILDMVDNEMSEGKTLDYKRDLPADNNDGKAEFLADVVSFANTAGGYMLFGVDEDKGVAIAVPGIELKDADEYGLRLENMCRDNIEPRMSPLQIRAIDLTSGRRVLAVRVQQSWQAPHRNRKDRHFYARNSKGKYPMDVSEIRAAMIHGSTVEDRIRQFRGERVAKVAANKGPRPLINGVKTVLHLVPVEAVSGTKRLNLNASHSKWMDRLRPMGNVYGYSSALNLDGAFYHDGAEESSAYTQLFRDGAIESVFTYPPYNDRSVLWGEFEKNVTEGSERYLSLLRSLEFAGPVAMLLAFVQAEESSLQVDNYNRFPAKGMSEPEILVPDFLLTDDADLPQTLRQMFEIVWNAYGRSRPHDYVPR